MLEALGVPIALAPEQAADMIDRYGFGYLHAPAHHPAMRHAGPVRRSLGVRTVFNLLGPLTNPAGARRQLIGVYAAQWVEPMGRALAELGCEHGMVVHGQPGIDELSPCGATTVATVRDGSVTISELDARELGVELCALSDLAGGDPQRNAEITLAVLGGEEGPAADATALNAARRWWSRARGRPRRGPRRGARGAAERSSHGDVVGAARRLEGPYVSYLDEIGAWTRERLEERRETRSLAASLLERGSSSVIAEVKRASPSQGAIAPGADPASVAQQYAADGAAAISVLTSGRDFGGSYADLAAVRAIVDLPILCKDFFVDVWQVTEARVHGADAILVLLALVEDALAVDLIQAAEDLEMETIVEVHSGPELERALDLGTPIIGVNARDLATLEIDRVRQIELLRRLPRGLLRIAESGIETPDHARAARDAGADALLVGTALMRDPALLPALVRSGA
jgi:indole-3-glycerol phosphate synthase